MPNARHTMESPEWYTPRPFVDAARAVMGGIDLDPASSEEANRVVQAATILTEHDEPKVWSGRVFLNPPGGQVPKFWLQLVASWHSGLISQAVWIGYSLEQLQTLQNIDPILTPLDVPMCVPNRRIAFVENEARRQARMETCRSLGKPFKEKLSPTHANYISYFGDAAGIIRFATIFSQFGQVRR